MNDMHWTDWMKCMRDHLPRDPKEMPSEVRHVLLVLATHADREGRCYPSLKTLGKEMGVHLSAARARIRAAVASGWLSIDHLGRWKGDPTMYRLTPKGCVHATLRARGNDAQRVALRAPKGSVEGSKGYRARYPNEPGSALKRVPGRTDGAAGGARSARRGAPPRKVDGEVGRRWEAVTGQRLSAQAYGQLFARYGSADAVHAAIGPPPHGRFRDARELMAKLLQDPPP